MDRWMQAYAVLTARQFPHADPTVPGTGAAGGLGFAFLSYMNAVLEPGASIVLEETSLESFIRDSDIVIPGYPVPRYSDKVQDGGKAAAPETGQRPKEGA